MASPRKSIADQQEFAYGSANVIGEAPRTDNNALSALA
jgi:hypothetical protein